MKALHEKVAQRSGTEGNTLCPSQFAVSHRNGGTMGGTSQEDNCKLCTVAEGAKEFHFIKLVNADTLTKSTANARVIIKVADSCLLSARDYLMSRSRESPAVRLSTALAI